MRSTLLNWLLARLKPALFVTLIAAGLMLLLLCPASAAPVEEDIPQSPPARHVKARPEPATMPSRSSATSVPLASSVPSDEATSPPAPPAPTAVTAPATAAAIHKYFPYTIRSGDTLETIADIFGVQVVDITRANRRIADGDLMAGDTIRIPNPFVTREAELNAEVERLSIDKAEAERKADQATNALASLHSQLESAAASNAHYEHDLHALPWWRAAAWAAAIAGVVLFGMMMAALIEWWNLRSRYRAVAEMNDSLRRLDYRYRMVMAKAELRLQELYGRRRRGIEDGQERQRIPEETELEQLDLQIKEILETYLERLGPPNDRARRARWRESIGAVGAPIEARTARR
jgi:murein DD-endopeptidase MepM/ murein hydrolase activator NlpD